MQLETLRWEFVIYDSFVVYFFQSISDATVEQFRRLYSSQMAQEAWRFY